MSDDQPALYDAGGRWRRWEPESFDLPEVDAAGDASSAHADDAAPALPDPAEVLAEIERLRETAKARGHAEGFAAGHTQGHEAGLKEGFEQGLKEGRETGHAEGHAQGLEAAREQVEQLRQLTEACAHALHNIEAETGQALLSLSVSIARQVLRSTLDAEPERILDLIREVV